MKREEQDSLLKQIQSDLKGQANEAGSGLLRWLGVGSRVPACGQIVALCDSGIHTKGKGTQTFFS